MFEYLLDQPTKIGCVKIMIFIRNGHVHGKIIDVGSYGNVRAAWHRLTGAKVAIKTYDKSKIKDEFIIIIIIIIWHVYSSISIYICDISKHMQILTLR